MSLTIPEGEIHGLLGPNGVGKTTLVWILATVLLPTPGERACWGTTSSATWSASRR